MLAHINHRHTQRKEIILPGVLKITDSLISDRPRFILTVHRRAILRSAVLAAKGERECSRGHFHPRNLHALGNIGNLIVTHAAVRDIRCSYRIDAERRLSFRLNLI